MAAPIGAAARHQRGVRQHADAGGGGRAAGLPAGGERPDVHDLDGGRGLDAPAPGAAPPTTTTTTTPSYLLVPRCPRDAPRPSPSRSCWSATPSPARSAWAWPRRRSQYNVQIANEGTPGCSLSMQTQIKVLFYSVAPDAPCDVDKNPDSLFDTWRKWVDAYNPDVVVYLARGETFDQEVGGRWQNIGQAAFDSLPGQPLPPGRLGARLEGGQRGLAHHALLRQRGLARRHAVARGRAGAGRGRQRHHAAGGPAAPAGADGSRVYVFDLNAVVSPDHAFSPTVGHINVRCADGVHFTQSGGIYVGQRLAPELAALGQCPRHGVAGWRVARSSATIDPVMVHEPALPVVRRATADDITAMAAQLARTFSDDPVIVPHLPQRRPPRGRPAGLLRHPDAVGLHALRGLLHDRGLHRLGRLGAGRQAVPHGARAGSSPCCPCCPTSPPTCAPRCGS